MNKLSWAVTAGDQDPDSSDDKKCGDHYIDKEKECHDGDAHRPDPGNNPYFQGGRKGPPGKDPSGKGKSEDGSRDRREVTKKAQDKKSDRERAGTPYTSDRAREFGADVLTDYKSSAEEAYERDFGQPLDWNGDHGQRLKNELAEMALRDMQREFAGEMDQRAGKDYLPNREGHERRDEPGSEPRQMFRPSPGSQDITFDPNVKIPPKGSGIYKEMQDLIDWGEKPDDGGIIPGVPEEHEKWGKDEHNEETDSPQPEGYQGPYRENQVKKMDQSPEEFDSAQKTRERDKKWRQEKRASDKKGAESSLAPYLSWGKIMQDRVADQGIDCDDMAEARPCEPGEDPKIGKCNPNTSPEPRGQQQPGMKPTSPAGKIDPSYRMSDSPKMDKGAPKPGIGIEPSPDASRESRMAQHVDFLSQDDATDPRATTNLLNKMMGGAAAEPQEDGSMKIGSQAASPKEAKQQNDDYKATLKASGWENPVDMGPVSTWTKGRVGVVLKQTKGGGNEMKVKGPQRSAPPKGRRR